MSFFYSYNVITQMNVKLVNLSPLRVGAGKGLTISEPDLPIIRTPDKKAVIPGSSMKGAIRNNLARLLKVNTDALSYIFGGRIDDFSVGSSILFTDFTSEKPVEHVERAHIQINLQTGGVRNLFSVEYVPENTVFKGKIIARNTPLLTLSRITYLSFFLLNSGIVKIGGFKSRGYGLVNVQLESIDVHLPSKEHNYKTRISLNGNEVDVSLKLSQDKLEVKERELIKTFMVNNVDESDILIKASLDPNSFINVGKELASGGSQ